MIGTSTDIEALKHSRDTLGIYLSRLRCQKNGNRYRAACPFHCDSTPSLDVYSYQGTWLHKCLGCGATGNIFQFLQRLDGITFPEAVQAVKNYPGKGITSIPAIDKPKTYRTYPRSWFIDFERQLATSKVAGNWLRDVRGITYDTASSLHFGFRQSITSLVPELQDILTGGWIAFPCFDADRVISIRYRSIRRKAFAREYGMVTALFNTQAISAAEDLWIVEGEFDCGCLAQCGLRSISIGSSTTPITAQMLDQIRQAKRVVLAGDSDEQGVAKMRELQAMIPGSLLLRWHSVKDANQLWLEHKGDVEGFRNRVVELAQEARKDTICTV